MSHTENKQIQTNVGTVSHKEPFIRMMKRDGLPLWKATIVRLAAILISLVVCALVIIAITKQNPIQVYAGIVDGAMGNSRRIWVTIREGLILLLIAVALTPAFKMRFWNIGAEGQVLMGAVTASALMIYANTLPGWILIAVIFVASCAAGMIWGLIPAVFKAWLNTNETLFTLMMNYVAMQIIAFCIVFWENPAGSNTVGVINAATQEGWFPDVLGLKYGLSLILVLLVTLGMHIYLKYSKQGYEIAVVGESENTARYAGMNVRKVIIRTMAISGAICGLAGCILVCGDSHTIATTTAGGRGFTAIIVAWMSKFNAAAMVVVSLLIVFMQQGAVQIATQFGLNESASDVITGIILFFLIGSEFFINYKVELRKKHKEVA